MVATTKRIVITYEEDGFEIFSGMFDKKSIDLLRASAYSLINTECKLESRGGFPSILHLPNKFGLQFMDSIRPIINDKIRANYKRVTNQFYFHFPGDSDSFNWHIDDYFRAGTADKYIQTAIVVDDWTIENGTIEFIRGSHRKEFKTKRLRHFERDGMKGHKVLAKSGDFVIWSGMVVHASHPNTSNSFRSYYMQGFQV